MGFDGFSQETTRFLAALAENNDKVWFDAHRSDYEAHVLEPAKAFVEAIAPSLKELSEAVHAEPRVNGSIFRIHRDVRFSKDKTPYKDHLDLWFWQGPEGRRSMECPGYFFRLTADRLWLGAGVHAFDKRALGRYRDAVADDTRGPALVAALAQAKGRGVRVGDTKYKRVPKPYESDHPRAELLKHGSLHVTWEGAIPRDARRPTFPEYCAARYRPFSGVMDWLAATLHG